MLDLLIEAAKVAVIGSDGEDKRNFLLGAIGIRRDGVTVSAKNGAVISSSYENYRIIGDAHAECRAIKKMGKGGTLYVSRVLKKDGSLAMARACGICRLRIQAAEIQKVYYTINPVQYGVWNVANDTDWVYNC